MRYIIHVFAIIVHLGWLKKWLPDCQPPLNEKWEMIVVWVLERLACFGENCIQAIQLWINSEVLAMKVFILLNGKGIANCLCSNIYYVWRLAFWLPVDDHILTDFYFLFFLRCTTLIPIVGIVKATVTLFSFLHYRIC